MIDKNTYNEDALFPQIAAVDFDGLLVKNRFPRLVKSVSRCSMP